MQGLPELTHWPPGEIKMKFRMNHCQANSSNWWSLGVQGLIVVTLTLIPRTDPWGVCANGIDTDIDKTTESKVVLSAALEEKGWSNQIMYMRCMFTCPQ